MFLHPTNKLENTLCSRIMFLHWPSRLKAVSFVLKFSSTAPLPTLGCRWALGSYLTSLQVIFLKLTVRKLVKKNCDG